jgi:hypothetical protein
MSLEAVKDALSAEKVVVRRGHLINVGPDYRVQLDGVGGALQFMQKLRHPLPVEDNQAGSVRMPIPDTAPSLERLLDRSLQAIQDAFSAERRVRRHGRVVTLGRDHRVRLKAAQMALQFFAKLTAHAGLRCA